MIYLKNIHYRYSNGQVGVLHSPKIILKELAFLFEHLFNVLALKSDPYLIQHLVYKLFKMQKMIS